MSFFPRFIENEFAPMFRLVDGYADHVATRSGNQFGPSFVKGLRKFTPRFDVKENKDNYELHGEVPGIEQQNLSIEFVDAQTLMIKGRTERHRESGTRPSNLIKDDQTSEQASIAEGSIEGSESGNYHKASVEDESQPSSTNPSTEPQQQVLAEAQPAETNEEKSRYWVSERSVGEFARTFSFPSRVDQDNVTASLKDGILSIVVPKAQAPALRRINIE